MNWKCWLGHDHVFIEYVTISISLYKRIIILIRQEFFGLAEDVINCGLNND